MSTSKRWSSESWEPVQTSVEGEFWTPYELSVNKGDDTYEKIDITPKDGNFENSYMIGEFTEKSTQKTKEGDSNIFLFKAFEFGQKEYQDKYKDTNYEEDGVTVKVWATAVIADKMHDITPGTIVKIQHKGKVEAKKSARTYHTWELFTLAGSASSAPDNTPTANKEEVVMEANTAFDNASNEELPPWKQ